jgi:4-amino-4-deoxy-L-arabinose transferase-like glycosyltransferase
LAIGIATLLLFVATLDRPVITWDEGYTIQREERMQEWFGHVTAPPSGVPRSSFFTPSALLSFWPFAREEPDGHPPLYAVIGNLGWLLCRDWVAESVAYRVGPVVLFCVTTAVMYGFLARRWGRLAGLAAAGTWVLMPRVFAHAHLASYDIPLACLWFLTAVCFWKGVEGWRRSAWQGIVWSLAFAFFLALAAATKFTGWLIPIPLIGWSAMVGGNAAFRAGRVSWPALVRAVVCFAAVGLVVPSGLEMLRSLRETQANLARREGEDGKEHSKRVADAFRASRANAPWTMLLLAPAGVWIATYASLAIHRARQVGGGEPRAAARHAAALAQSASPPRVESTSAPILDTWAAASLAPILTIALIPNWWPDPIGSIAIFLWSNLTRQNTTWIPTQFFGSLYEFSLPWYNTLVWVTLTVPALSLLLMALGVFAVFVPDSAKPSTTATPEPAHGPVGAAPPSDAKSLGWLILWNAATLLVIRAMPGAPGHDSERQLLGSFPFLACIAGLGSVRLVRWLEWRLPRGAALGTASAVVVASLATAGAGIWHYRNAPLAYYTELIGGVRGATRLGLEPTYYWDAFDGEAIEWLNEHTAASEKVLFCNNFDGLEYLGEWGLLHPATLPRDSGAYRWFVLQNRPGLYVWNAAFRSLAERGEAAYVHQLDGVPLIWIFPISEYERIVQDSR